MGCACGKEVLYINGKHYTVKARLGEGGCSVVDLIQDQKTYRSYALKRISCHSKDDERTAIQEAEYHSTFNHPNIVNCVDFALLPNIYNSGRSEVRIVLPYYRKGTLQDELIVRAKFRNPFPEDHILSFFRQMCEGVRVMHNAQPYPLAHRDLKPSNVLISDDNTPVWMDLGSMGRARVEIHKTSQAVAMQDLAAAKCTMPYRAPELFQIESHSSIDERVDVWSLGCCLYAMCYFKTPFEETHERGDSVALAVISGIINFPENSQYSNGLHNLIKSMLEVSALQRPFIDGVLLQIDTLISQAENRL